MPTPEYHRPGAAMQRDPAPLTTPDPDSALAPVEYAGEPTRCDNVPVLCGSITAVVDRDLDYVAAGRGCRSAGASGWPDKLVTQAWKRGKVSAAAVIMPVCGTDQSRGSRCRHGRP